MTDSLMGFIPVWKELPEENICVLVISSEGEVNSGRLVKGAWYQGCFGRGMSHPLAWKPMDRIPSKELFKKPMPKQVEFRLYFIPFSEKHPILPGEYLFYTPGYTSESDSERWDPWMITEDDLSEISEHYSRYTHWAFIKNISDGEKDSD